MKRILLEPKILLVLILFFVWQVSFAQKTFTAEQIESLKKEVTDIVQQNHKMSQVMVD